MAIARGAFEYQGQKCSAASRVYVPQSLWPEVRDRVVAMMRDMKMGDVADFRTFIGAVIDRKSFDEDQRLSGRCAEERDDHPGRRRTRRCGVFRRADAGRNDRSGYRLMCEEIFGPVLTAYAYPDAQVGRDPGRCRPDVALCADRRRVRARPRGDCAGDRALCAMPPATSTSTTSRPARWSDSSRSAARANPAPTTRPARR